MRTNRLMRKIPFFVAFCLAFQLCVAWAPSRAEEFKPFLTVKLAAPETLLQIADKIAELAGTSDDFNAVVAPFRDLKGLNRQAPIGFVLRSDGEEIKEPILFVPINDPDAVEIPGFETVRAGLKKDGDGKYFLNSPLGMYDVRKKNDFLVVTPADSEAKAPDDPKTLIAGLEPYALALKFDFENTSFESIETLLAPFMMFAAMQGGAETAQALENFNDQIKTLHDELRSATIGIVFDPKTADLEWAIHVLPRKDSDMTRQIAFSKEAKTMFSGFLGSDNPVFSMNGVELYTESSTQMTLSSLDQFFNGILEQVEINAEEDADVEDAEAIVGSLRTIMEATMRKGKCDVACSLSADGVLLFATTFGDTKELDKLGTLVMNQVKKQLDKKEIDDFIKENLKKDHATVEGYKISKLTIPVAKIAEKQGCPADLKDMTFCLYWGIKDGEAVALALGPDGDKLEKEFNAALAKTKTPVAVKQPVAVFGLQPLGTLLKKFSFDQIDPEAAKTVELLTKAGSDAKMTVTNEIADETLIVRFAVDGKSVRALVDIFKAIAASQSASSGSLNRTQIRTFE